MAGKLENQTKPKQNKNAILIQLIRTTCLVKWNSWFFLLHLDKPTQAHLVKDPTPLQPSCPHRKKKKDDQRTRLFQLLPDSLKPLNLLTLRNLKGWNKDKSHFSGVLSQCNECRGTPFPPPTWKSVRADGEFIYCPRFTFCSCRKCLLIC